ncbi:Pentatricopeptide repeat-containing protein [Thalictrum thalictroides]|uniref:Pentatricopeptide repeat-containing protein n=1 Tax=Thalictrum thalictroides TaxID=46969 RepID=A0A7J6VRR7_THATH|nr:Pentatricopeptide repeat-containing protein [Thalictrum thalictroides]
MKLVFTSNGFKSLSSSAFSRIGGVLFYSKKTKTEKPKKVKRESVYSRISPISDSSVSVVPILVQWIEEGKEIKKEDLNTIVKQLKISKRFKHALEISEWMCNQGQFVLSPSDIAVQLNLVSRIHGVEQAEKYFKNITKQYQVFPVYLSLLNCYAHEKSIEKAEALMNEMKEFKIARTSLSYNVMLNLYSRVGQYEKLDTLLEEMEENCIPPNEHTFSVMLNAYASTSNINGMEKILEKMEVDPEVNMDWNNYAMAASGYIKAGLTSKALGMLKKAEELITERTSKSAYDLLLKLYAETGKKEELYRVWDKYKLSEKDSNPAYQRMIGSLLKLDDITGSEKILEEWESGCPAYDFRVPNLLIDAYCKNGLLEKAEILVNKTIEKGKKPFANTWEILATGYLEDNQIPKAVEALKSAFLARWPGWKPHRDTLAACLLYLKQQGDAEKTEEFVRLLGAPGHMSIDDCERLLDYIYLYNRQEESGGMNEMTGDSMAFDDEQADKIAKEAN